MNTHSLPLENTHILATPVADACLSICHKNAQSLASMPHLEKLREMTINEDPHLIAISETWLDETIPDNKVNLPNYHIVRHDRIKKGGGGVCLYIRNDITSYSVIETSRNVVPTEYTKQSEYIFVKINFNKNTLLICVVYRPPTVSLRSILI